MDHSFLVLVLLVPCLLCFSSALETIGPTQSLSDGETLVSQAEVFELGFFSPAGSANRFLGIWYKKIPDRTVVWVANRDNPINGSPGNLTLTASGNLVLLSYSSDTIVWSTNTTSSKPMSSSVRLLATGNLVLQDGSDPNSEVYLWQSFDYPTDTFLPDMKIGWDLKRGLNRHLVAWKSPSDPSSSDFTWGLELHSYPEAVAWKGNHKYFRSGPWNGIRYSGAPEQKPNNLFWFKFVSNEEEVYYTYGLQDKSVLTRNVLNRSNDAWERSAWSDPTQEWKYYSSVPKDKCDNYNFCGPHGYCDMANLGCQCLEGFSPKSPDKWAAMDWTQGCKRDKPLQCGDKVGFKKFTNMKLPDTTSTWVNASLDIKACHEKCLGNCSCTAYTHSDIRASGSGCALWFGDLLDIRTFSDGGQDLHIRMAASELGGDNGNRLKIAVAAVVGIVGALGTVFTIYCCHRSRTKSK
ncbi:hypothetical protein CRG98_028424, partial [Punica granatum]